jgi:hypothetical protein
LAACSTNQESAQLYYPDGRPCPAGAQASLLPPDGQIVNVGQVQTRLSPKACVAKAQLTWIRENMIHSEQVRRQKQAVDTGG